MWKKKNFTYKLYKDKKGHGYMEINIPSASYDDILRYTVTEDMLTLVTGGSGSSVSYVRNRK